MTTPFLSSGQQIVRAAESLQTVTLADVAEQVRTNGDLHHRTDRLRKLAQFDQDAYRSAKTSLPYVVGGLFREGVRRIDALETATYFILDLDHCPDLAGGVPDALRADWSVALAFVSPSGNGLKLFFRLLDGCTDAQAYSAAYRNFASDFGRRHGLAKSIDLRTSDASRACFLAYDPDAYYNPEAMPVDWRLWLPEEAEQPASAVEEGVAPIRKPVAERPVNEEAYREVLRAINPNTPVRRQKQVFVPAELAAIEPAVTHICTGLGWQLVALMPLNYGLKVAVQNGFRRAEVNVFYGKRGFSVVRSPRTGTDPALADRLHAELYKLLFPESVVRQVPISICAN